MYVKSVIQQS